MAMAIQSAVEEEDTYSSSSVAMILVIAREIFRFLQTHSSLSSTVLLPPSLFASSNPHTTASVILCQLYSTIVRRWRSRRNISSNDYYFYHFSSSVFSLFFFISSSSFPSFYESISFKFFTVSAAASPPLLRNASTILPSPSSTELEANDGIERNDENFIQTKGFNFLYFVDDSNSNSSLSNKLSREKVGDSSSSFFQTCWFFSFYYNFPVENFYSTLLAVLNGEDIITTNSSSIRTNKSDDVVIGVKMEEEERRMKCEKREKSGEKGERRKNREGRDSPPFLFAAAKIVNFVILKNWKKYVLRSRREKSPRQMYNRFSRFPFFSHTNTFFSLCRCYRHFSYFQDFRLHPLQFSHFPHHSFSTLHSHFPRILLRRYSHHGGHHFPYFHVNRYSHFRPSSFPPSSSPSPSSQFSSSSSPSSFSSSLFLSSSSSSPSSSPSLSSSSSSSSARVVKFGMFIPPDVSIPEVELISSFDSLPENVRLRNGSFVSREFLNSVDEKTQQLRMWEKQRDIHRISTLEKWAELVNVTVEEIKKTVIFVHTIKSLLPVENVQRVHRKKEELAMRKRNMLFEEVKIFVSIENTILLLEQWLQRPPTIEEWRIALGLSSEEDLRFRLRQGQEALESLTESQIDTVRKVVKTYNTMDTFDDDDLLMVGMDGIKIGLRRYNPLVKKTQNISLSSPSSSSSSSSMSTSSSLLGALCWTWSKNSILKHIQKYSESVEIPTHWWSTFFRGKKIERRLESENRKPPTLDEVAKELGVRAEKWEEIKKATRRSLSTETIVQGEGAIGGGGGKGDGPPEKLGDLMASTDEAIRMESLTYELYIPSTIQNMMKNCLTDVESRVVQLRFGLLKEERSNDEEEEEEEGGIVGVGGGRQRSWEEIRKCCSEVRKKTNAQLKKIFNDAMRKLRRAEINTAVSKLSEDQLRLLTSDISNQTNVSSNEGSRSGSHGRNRLREFQDAVADESELLQLVEAAMGTPPGSDSPWID